MPFTPTNFVNNQQPPLSAAQVNKLGTQHAQAVADITARQGAANGIATLGSDGFVSDAQLPSSLDPAVVPVWKNKYNITLKGDWVGNDAAGTGTNDTATFLSLIAAVPEGSTILFDRSKRYRIDPIVITGKSLILDFNFCTIITKTMDGIDFTVAKPFIKWRSEFDVVREMTSTGASLAATTAAITPSSAALAFAPGDYVLVYDDFRFVKWDAVYNPADSSTYNPHGRGEMNRIDQASSGSISFRNPLSHPYTNSQNRPKVVKILTPVIDPQVRNVGLIRDTNPGGPYTGFFGGTPDGPHLFAFEGCIRPAIVNATARGWVGHFAHFSRSIAPYSQNLVGYYPFFPAEGGHGYVSRMHECTEGQDVSNTGYGVRHVVNYAGSARSGSRNCKGFESVNASYQTHGLDSRDCYSIDDAVIGGTSRGWSFGNPQHSADYGYEIVRPKSIGNFGAIGSRSRSQGLAVIHPNLMIGGGSSAAIEILEGSGDIMIDLTGGKIRVTSSTSASIRATPATALDGSTVNIGDVQIFARGANSFEDVDTSTVSINIAGTLTTSDVPASAMTVVAAGATRSHVIA